jgi:Mrp family chromosome partitioning ATPase
MIFLLGLASCYYLIQQPKVYYKAEAKIVFIGDEKFFSAEIEAKRIREKDFLQKIAYSVETLSEEDISKRIELEFKKHPTLSISFVSENPIEARDIANLTASLFVSERKAAIKSLAEERQGALKALSDDIAEWESGLISTERRLRDLKQQHLESDQKRHELRLLLAESNLKRQELLKVFTDRHPEVVSISNRIDILESELKELPDTSNEYDRLKTLIKDKKSQLAFKQNEYEQLYGRLRKEPLPWDAEIEAMASTPKKPIGPNRLWYYFYSVVGSFIFALLAAFLIEVADTRVHTREEAEKRTGLPVIADVGKLPGLKRKDKSRGGYFLLQNMPNSSVTKKLEQCYAFLKIEEFKGSIFDKSLLFTSIDMNSGKDFIAYKLAVIAARNGERVLLVDADFHNPSLGTFFKLNNAEGGLSDLLRGNISQKESIKNITDLLLSGSLKLDDKQLQGLDSLKMLLAGSKVENPLKILEQAKLRSLFKELSKDYGMLVINAPASGTYPDAFNFIKIADSVVIVVKKHKSRYADLNKIINQCRKIKANLTGMIFTNV